MTHRVVLIVAATALVAAQLAACASSPERDAAVPASPTGEQGDDGWFHALCPAVPLCEFVPQTLRAGLRRCVLTTRYSPPLSDTNFWDDAMSTLRDVLTTVQGQEDVIPRLTGTLEAWLNVAATSTTTTTTTTTASLPHESGRRARRAPVVLYFTGASGTGKTLTARLISLPLSLRCHAAHKQQEAGTVNFPGLGSRTRCLHGDALLIISATAFAGMSVDQAARVATERIAAHARWYPRGIVLLDDNFLAWAAGPAVLRALEGGTLLGYTDVSQVLFIVTSATVGAAAATTAAGDSRCGADNAANVAAGGGGCASDDTHPTVPETLERLGAVHFAFRPLSVGAMEAIVRQVVAEVPCLDRWRRVVSASIADSAAAAIVGRIAPVTREAENGHALRRAMEDALRSDTILLMESLKIDVAVHLRYRLAEGSAGGVSLSVTLSP